MRGSHMPGFVVGGHLSNLIKYVERLKLEPIGILKSDQFHTVSMHLTEMFVSKDMKVNLLQHGPEWL